MNIGFQSAIKALFLYYVVASAAGGQVAWLYYILLCNVTPVTGQKVYCSSSRLFLVDSLADGRYYSMYGVRQGGHQEGQPIETSLRNKQ